MVVWCSGTSNAICFIVVVVVLVVEGDELVSCRREAMPVTSATELNFSCFLSENPTKVLCYRALVEKT